MQLAKIPLAKMNWLLQSMKKLIDLGSHSNVPYSLSRNLMIVNLVSYALLIIGITFAVAVYTAYGEAYTYFGLEGLFAGLVALVPPLLNAIGFINASRLLFSIQMPVVMMFLSIWNKIQFPGQSPFEEFYSVKMMLIGFLIFPFLSFSLEEKKILLPAALLNVILLISFDPIHDALGVGFLDIGLNAELSARRYAFSSNSFPFITYALMLGGIFLVKYFHENSETHRELLVDKLRGYNVILAEKQKEVEERNSEIMAQSEELVASQEELMQAYEVIQSQKEILEATNSKLTRELYDKNIELTETNRELIKYNEELRQFSYTVSHNLRAPVARIIGLANLIGINGQQSPDEIKVLAQHLHSSTQNLDDIISDLSKIIDIRNEIYRIKEKVYFQEEWDRALTSLRDFITSDMHFIADFSKVPFLYTVKPIINSVFYNLLSNSIKYRSTTTSLEVQVSATIIGHNVLLTFTDNGLGIDLEQFGGDVFKMYKRFHTHAEGKGLGLYMVKTQVEQIKGKVSLVSKLNRGTSFFIQLRKPDKIDGQIYFDSSFARITYNAHYNCATIVWKKKPQSKEYRTVFTRTMEMIRLYRTPIWLTDSRKQVSVEPEDQQWLFKFVIPQVAKEGLQYCANVHLPEQRNDEYRIKSKETLAQLKIDIQYFESLQEAQEWIESIYRHSENGFQQLKTIAE